MNHGLSTSLAVLGVLLVYLVYHTELNLDFVAELSLHFLRLYSTCVLLPHSHPDMYSRINLQ